MMYNLVLITLNWLFKNLGRYSAHPSASFFPPPLCSAPRHARVATRRPSPASVPRASSARPILHDDAAALSFPATVFSFSSPSSSSWNSSRARPHRRADELRPPFLDFAHPRPPPPPASSSSLPRFPGRNRARVARPPLTPPRGAPSAAVDSPSPVSYFSIPCARSISSLPSLDFPPHQASSPSLQGRWRSPPPAAAVRRRAAPSSLLSARAVVGELCRRLEHALRAPPAPLQPCFAAPPSAASRASWVCSWT